MFQKSGLKSNETHVQESENISNWNELTEKLELIQTDFNDFVKFNDNIVVFDGNTETDFKIWIVHKKRWLKFSN